MPRASDRQPRSLAPRRIVLWIGPKHSGKTTRATHLVQAARAGGFVVAGCLAPSLYANGVLLGFDIVNLRSQERAPLARRRAAVGEDRGFCFLPEGLALGVKALGPGATRDADLIIVDEYGPRELAFLGWRDATDRLMTSSEALLLLVVREELVDQVQLLYQAVAARRLVAIRPESIDEVLTMLRNNHS
jgi:nucleoside-triphosphatase THEP1